MGQAVYEVEALGQWIERIRSERRTNLLPIELAIHLQCSCRRKMDTSGMKFWGDVALRLACEAPVIGKSADSRHDSF